MNWREIPFVRLVLPFAAGISVYSLSWESWLWGYSLPLLVGWGSVLALVARRRLSYRGSLRCGLGLMSLWFLLGGALAHRADGRHQLPVWEKACRQPAYWLSRVLVVRRSRLIVETWARRPADGRWESRKGRLLIYLPEDSTALPGDTLLLFGRPARIAGPRNPEAFDFRRYMGTRGVYFQLYLAAGEYERRPGRHATGWRGRAYRLRARCLAILKSRLVDPGAYAVGAALTLGYRDELDEELRDAYAASGAMHILAVSGLHVGLVFFGTRYLLSWLGSVRILQFLGQIGGIWAFVLLAGLPPSGVRAAAMCSFFALGRISGRETNSFNLLAASAFFMLAATPRQLFDVGFQLSYAAVAGILALQGPIYRCWRPPFAVFDYLWKLLSVSIAAQVGTLGVSLYYFHQFPLLFWLSGFLAVPAASLALGGGLALLLLHGAPGIGPGLGMGLNTLLAAVNGCMQWIAGIPGAQLTGIWIGPAGAGLYYGLLALVLAGWHARRAWYWRLALVLGLVASLCRGVHSWKLDTQRRVVVYYVHKHTLLDVWDGRTYHSFFDSEITPAQQERAARNFRWSQRGVAGEETALSASAQQPVWRYRHGLLQFYGRRLLVVDASTRFGDLPRIAVDILLIRGDPQVSIAEIAGTIRPDLVILDASLPPWRAEEGRQACAAQGLICHDIRRDGAALIPW